MVGSEKSQYFTNRSTVFEQGLVKGKNVVHETNSTALVDEILEYVIHHSLECGWRVAKAKEHDEWFIQPSVCPEGCFVLVSFFDTDIVEAPSQVKLCEVLGSTQPVQDVGDKGQWVGVLYCYCI
jgi:hypothetical protein